MEDNKVLKTHGLGKSYGGFWALQNLELEVERGSVFGLLGPNGSGKTTTLAMLLGILKPTQGSFEWFGSQYRPSYIKKIGAILETPNFYPYLTGFDNLKIVAKIKGVSEERIQEVLAWVKLAEHSNKFFKQYSLGMKQRLAIASALLNEPEVLILDEPTNGLDPAGIVQIREMIAQISERGTTIILASHLLDEVEKVCTHYAVLEKGKLLRTDQIKNLNQGQVQVEIAAEDMNALNEGLQRIAFVNAVASYQNVWVATLSAHHTAADLNKALFEQGISCTHLSKHGKSLERTFLDLTNRK